MKKGFTTWRVGDNIIHYSSMLLLVSMKLMASDDACGNWDGGADCGGSNEYAHDYGCDGPRGNPGGHSGVNERGANGPNHLCAVIFSDGPSVFAGYDEIVRERALEAQGANGPSGPCGPS